MKSQARTALFSFALISAVLLAQESRSCGYGEEAEEAASLRKPVEVDARVHHRSCSYYSGTDGDVWVRYTNTNLPWGTKVTLVWGQAGDHYLGNGEVRPIHWRQRNEMGMSVTEPYTWTTPMLHLPITDRGSSEQFWGIDFVFKITSRDGREIFDNGGLDPWGYYNVDLKDLPRGCLPDNQVQAQSTGVKAVKP